jgi:nucleotide-binding universal stress UspA family protein
MRKPVVVAFDGSEEACRAMETAVELFGDRLLLVVSVWEPGLMMPNPPATDFMGSSLALADGEQVREVEDAQRDHATAMVGSTTQRLLHKAHLPVVVVRRDKP